MTFSVAVVTPLRTMEPHRVKLADWCRRRWEAFGYEVTYCDDGAQEGPFGRSKAVNRGVASVDAEYVIVADADIAPHPGQIEMLMEDLWVADGWIVAYDRFVQVNRRATDLILDGAADQGLPRPIADEWIRWQGTDSVCGLLAFRHEDFDTVGGFDTRAVGWGGDDRTFAWAMDTLIGPHSRLPYDCVHLWHPQRQDRKTDRWASANFALEDRYREANGDVDAMTALRREDLNQRAWT